jgi:hypothetical protein
VSAPFASKCRLPSRLGRVTRSVAAGMLWRMRQSISIETDLLRIQLEIDLTYCFLRRGSVEACPLP